MKWIVASTHTNIFKSAMQARAGARALAALDRKRKR
jgi:hypothetical protein